MQILDDIWSSIKGNSKARVRDPIVGTFIVSWAFCNWDKLAVLLWGSGEAEQRIKLLVKSMAVINDPSLLVSDLDLIFNPFILTIIYLFVLPTVSLWVKKMQDGTILSQHSHAIELDIKRAQEQKSLNKVILRANPEKEFLEKEILLDLRKEEERLERRNKIKSYIESKAASAKAKADESAAKAEKARIELESKRLKEEIEKRRFDEQTAIFKATMSSARYPAIHLMMKSLSDSLQQDGIVMSLGGLSESIAALFGYADSNEMIEDDKFNNENLHQIKYVYHQPSLLTKRLEEIITSESLHNEDLSEGLLYDHLSGVLEGFLIDFMSDESLAEKISESIDEESYDILASNELSDVMGGVDTIFEEIEFGLDNFAFTPKEGFKVHLSGYASGYHRHEEDIPGRELIVRVEAVCEPLIGRYGLSKYRVDVDGKVREYD